MKFLFDILPVLLFFVAYKLFDIFVATAVAIGTTILQIGWTWHKHRKVDTMLWVSLAVIVVFGGATLVLQDETFIKWKPTVLYWLFAVVLIVAQAGFGKNLIHSMLQGQVTLPHHAWVKLNLSWIGFLLFMGLVNLYVAFNYSTDAWVTFKLFGGMGLMLLFVLVQGLMLSKYIEPEEEKEG
ncbi:MAG TPA: septation protein A [Burkholderiales bacterium]|nr:septation protein A [Burkholderiales bacterium]